MEHLSREELARMLDRVAHLYPGGVPSSLIVAPEQEVPAAPEADVAYVVPAPDPLPTVLETLLGSITVKGLLLDPNRAITRLCSVADEADVVSVLQELAAARSAKVILVLGSTLEKAGTWSEVFGVPVLHTRSLAEIEADKAAKREFWGHLQMVIKALGEP